MTSMELSWLSQLVLWLSMFPFPYSSPSSTIIELHYPYPNRYHFPIWLVVWTILKNISQWEGLSHILWNFHGLSPRLSWFDSPYIMENKKYSKPPTRLISWNWEQLRTWRLSRSARQCHVPPGRASTGLPGIGQGRSGKPDLRSALPGLRFLGCGKITWGIYV